MTFVRRVVRSSRYERDAARLLRPSVQQELEESIAAEPERHPLIPGTGGFRKARWARRGKGKSGGFRVVYFFLGEQGRIYMAAIYAKSRKKTLSAVDQNVLARLATQIKKAARGG